MEYPKRIVKRDGTVVDFNVDNVIHALNKCFAAIRRDSYTQIEIIADSAIQLLKAKAAAKQNIITVELMQDCVEITLQTFGEFDAAKAYILYRDEQKKKRELVSNQEVPNDVKQAFAASAAYFPTELQQFQFYDKYSRFNYEIGRRETWIETVDRTVNFLHELASPYADLGGETYTRIRKAILEMRILPSMRLLAMAGAPAKRDNVTIYNCSYLPVDSLESFVEAMHISMAGCGVGFSVESREVSKLPEVAYQRNNTKDLYVVEDTAEGWAKALSYGLYTWMNGDDVIFDTSLLRDAGTILRTKGGRASGPVPLQKLLNFTRDKILAKQGSYLSTLDAHDIMCAVGSAAVAGGVRRTAMISLFDADDSEMLHCKDGDLRNNLQRHNANNSIVLERSLNQYEFTDIFWNMIKNGRGEPGIFSRENARHLAPPRRQTDGIAFGTNPCGEINLRPRQFCNLSAVVNKQGLSFEDLRESVELSTLIGTIQSLATYFPNLSNKWKENCEEERLLGVDITGQMDNPDNLSPDVMKILRQDAIYFNRLYAQTFGINQSASITCVKPSGNSAVLVDCSSGLHARWAKFYIKNIRASVSSALVKAMKDVGVKMSPENGGDGQTVVIPFPVRAPEGTPTRHDRNVISQLEWWLHNKKNWTEHNPSVSITYKPTEVLDMMEWVYKHQEYIGGMAFFPAYDGKYDQLPWVEISEEDYNNRMAAMPKIDWSKVWLYEKEDYTTAAQELACTAGLCEL